MIYKLSEEFRRKYKKQDVRIRKAIDKTLLTFTTNSSDSSLHNHQLKREWSGYRSIDIDYPKDDLRSKSIKD